MASDILQRRHARFASGEEREEASLSGVLAEVLWPIASLKLTVAPMAMAIFLILAGTLAQIDKDIWQVMRQYFRTPLAWVDVRTFFRATGTCRASAFPSPAGS